MSFSAHILYCICRSMWPKEHLQGAPAVGLPTVDIVAASQTSKVPKMGWISGRALLQKITDLCKASLQHGSPACRITRHSIRRQFEMFQTGPVPCFRAWGLAVANERISRICIRGPERAENSNHTHLNDAMSRERIRQLACTVVWSLCPRSFPTVLPR